MICFRKPVLVTNISFYNGSFLNFAGRFYYEKAIICRYRCYSNLLTIKQIVINVICLFKYNLDQNWYVDLSRTEHYNTNVVNIEIQLLWQQQMNL